MKEPTKARSTGGRRALRVLAIAMSCVPLGAPAASAGILDEVSGAIKDPTGTVESATAPITPPAPPAVKIPPVAPPTIRTPTAGSSPSGPVSSPVKPVNTPSVDLPGGQTPSRVTESPPPNTSELALPDAGMPAAGGPAAQPPPPTRQDGNAAGSGAGARSIATARMAPLRGWLIRVWPAVALSPAAILASLLDLGGSDSIQPGLAQFFAALTGGTVGSGGSPARPTGGGWLSEVASLPGNQPVNPGGGFFEPSRTEISLLLLAAAAVAILLLVVPRGWYPNQLRRLPNQLRRF